MSKAVLLEQPSSLDFEVWENIVDDHGNPRLSEARNYFFPLTQDKIGLLCNVFQYWRDFHEYMLLFGRNRETGEELRLAVKCSKRGNDVYAKRLDNRLSFLNKVKNVKFFSNVAFDKEAYAESNLLWITLTYDPKLCSLHEAWENSYYELHKFKANLENHYGKIEWLTFIQPFPNQNGEAYGYPHFHILVFFKEASFSAFPRLEKDSEGRTVLRYRVKEKREIEIQGKWDSYIDVQAISSVRGASNYCKKYAESVCYGDSDKAILNGAVSWLFRKKSFTLTRGFQKALHDLIVSMRVRKRVFQKGLDGEVAYAVWEWDFCGIRSASVVGVPSGNVWVLSLDEDSFEKLVKGFESSS